MPQRPQNVIWDDNDTGTLAPDPGEQADGHAQGDTMPRQTLNWLFRNLGLMGRYLIQSLFRSDDSHADQICRAHSNAPSTGAGFGPVAGGDFVARVYVGGIAVGPVDSPAHTYAANSDTYWDLDEDGLWTAVPVANAASEPALTANSIRVFMVETDATDRTAVTDYTPAHVTVDQPLRLQGTTYRQEVGSPTYQLQDQDQDSAGAERPSRVYRGNASSLYGADCRVLAFNCTWTGSVWNRDVAGYSYVYFFGGSGVKMLTRAPGLSTGWADVEDPTTGFSTPLYLNDFGFSELLTYGDLNVTGNANMIGGVTGADFLYGSPVAKRVSINGAEGACEFTGDEATGYNHMPAGQGIYTAVTAPVSYSLDSNLPDGAVLTGITIYGSIGSVATTRISVGRLDKSSGAVSYFKSGTTYDSFASRTFVSAIALTLDAAFASTPLDFSAYSYFIFIDPQPGQNGGEIGSIDVRYTVAKPS